MRQRLTSMGLLVPVAVVFFLAAATALQAQTCGDWKSVTGWQGTYTLSSNGQFVHGIIDRYFISETSGAAVSMPTMTGGLCNQLRWQGPDLHNTGSVNDSTQVLNACMQGQWFTTDTLIGSTGFPSNSELVVDFTGGTFSFQPIPSVSATHTVYSCTGQQGQNIQWGTYPATNWPLSFTLPNQVGPLTVTNYVFNAANHYAGYQDIAWTFTFNLTPILPGYNALTVTAQGNGTVTSTDGFINCSDVCTHTYPPNTPVTLNATPAQGWSFTGWSGACSGTGPCNVTMTQNQSVTATFNEPTNPVQFVPVTPCRLVDTRNPNGEFGGPALQAKSARSFTIPNNQDCNIPSSAAAYSLNVTAVPYHTLGYLTVWPTGQQQPLVSTLNSYDGRVKANAAIVPAGVSGAVSFYVTDTTELVLDIDGYFIPVSDSTLAFYPLPPCRVADTRNPNGPLGGPFLQGGVNRDFPVLDAAACNIPGSAQVYSLNLTVVPHGSLGYLTVCPTPSDPSQNCPVVSTLNANEGKVTANAAIVPAGTSGEIRTFPKNDTDLIIDINGYFGPQGAGGLSLYPVTPCRVLDTRPPYGSGAFRFELNPPVDVLNSPCGASSNSQAYVFNATVVPQGGLGYLSLWPEGLQQPVVSTLNAYDGVVSSNMAIVPAGTAGKVDAYAQPVHPSDPKDLTNLILDISSYFAP